MNAQRGQATILVVDDDTLDRTLLDDMLTSRGYRVLTAKSGREALAQFDASAGEIDLVLLDRTLPDINGIEVHRQLKARGGNIGRFTPVIMVTAQKDEEAKVSGLEGGLEDYVTKPFNPRELQARIDNMLRIRQNVVELEQIEDRRIRALEAQRSKLYTIGEMVSEVIHEIHNPINGILNYADLLAEGEIEGQDDGKELLRIIRGEANRIRDLVERLLTLRRSDEGMHILDIAQVLDEALTITKFLLKKSNVEVVRRYEPGRFFLMGESSRLVQVVLNLIYNAVYALDQKFPSGKGKRLVFEVTLGDPQRIIVRVNDNGTGIPTEILHRIMEPEFTTKKAGEGNGLGLSIAESIIKDHGGTIEVSSASQEFTEFRLNLPAVTDLGSRF